MRPHNLTYMNDQTSEVFKPKQMFSKFDQIVIGFLTTISLLVGLILWRGDTIGFAVLETFPQGQSASAQTQIKVLFDSPISVAENVQVTLAPEVTGQLSVVGNQLIFQADAPLQSNTTYAVTIDGTLRNDQNRALKEPIRWTFQTGSPRILFISWGEDGTNQIYQAEVGENGRVYPLSQAASDVTDFLLSPDGSIILYTVYRDLDGGSDLWQMNSDGTEPNLLLDCEMAACSQAVWVPNSTRVVYERRTIPADGAPPGLPRLWWLDVATGQTVPVFQDSQLLGLGATISADGRWMSFVSPTDQGIQIYNLENGDGLFIPNRMGSPAAWNPDTNGLLVNDIQLEADNQWEVHLLEVDVETDEIVSLSGEMQLPVDDSMPVYSPDGQWVAFGRKEARTAMGRQLWIMQADGSNPYAVTNDPDVHYGPFLWSENGRFLIMQQYKLKEQFAQPNLMLYDTQTDTWQEIASPATQPFAWIP